MSRPQNPTTSTIDAEDIENLPSCYGAIRTNPSRSTSSSLPAAAASSQNQGLPPSLALGAHELQYEPKGMVSAKIPTWRSYPSIDDEIDDLYEDETLQVS